MTDWYDTDPLKQARRSLKTRDILRDTRDLPLVYPADEMELSDLSVGERVEQATLDYLESEAATVWPIADRPLQEDDVWPLAHRLRRSGYDDVLVFHPSHIMGVGGPYDANTWRHDGMALAVAPAALVNSESLYKPLGRVESIFDASPPWVVRDPKGVAVAKEVSTDFEWGAE